MCVCENFYSPPPPRIVRPLWPSCEPFSNPFAPRQKPWKIPDSRLCTKPHSKCQLGVEFGYLSVFKQCIQSWFQQTGWRRLTVDASGQEGSSAKHQGSQVMRDVSTSVVVTNIALPVDCLMLLLPQQQGPPSSV